MKKTVWTFGLISGVLVSAMMAATLPFQGENGFDHSLLVGYATMVLSFLLIYFGVRSYRDNVGRGTVGFGRALAVGSLIGVVASVCYVATWEVMYFKFMPDFMTRYGVHEIQKARAAGASEATLAQKKGGARQVRADVSEPGHQCGLHHSRAVAGGFGHGVDFGGGAQPEEAGGPEPWNRARDLSTRWCEGEGNVSQP
jgi:hypothetical protein